ncbi:acyltransferase family protein [Rhizobium sp. 57MFTsu3.2]|uniref:acyltransferase family protein n=1 Tax=Rhizobium sp. 57MFTsu3.2 TaxID=1048681 RepID=UPI00146D44C0|nr:acyltransferase family protein [Rhizobium sp. 57MFTsu3.2]NMN72645.1 peptidoglycan/LPS O-acetylase OafA/YrhL [Rhizobium sp. 57MFTsu3.2]
MNYRAEIDGLRAIAVVPVLFFHAAIYPFSGGYVGVDIFFVISGYLITGILLNEIEQGSFSVVGFYDRRIRRIYPALFATIVVTAIAAAFVLYADDLKDFGQSVIATLTFMSNVLFWHETNYFAPNAEFKPLLHTWSLAVEEQFYVLFPLLLSVLAYRGRRSQFAVIAILTLISFAAADVASLRSPASAFFLLPFRAWELSVGALLALYENGRSRPAGRIASIAAIVGLLLIAYAIVGLDLETPFPGRWALLPVCGALLVLHFAQPSNLIGRILGSPVPVAIGLISYSLYLVHQPIFALYRYARIAEPSRFEMVALIALSFVLASISWKLVEQPFRRVRYRSRTVFASAACGSLVLISFGVVAHLNAGFPSWTLARLSPQQAVVYRNLLEERGRIDKVADRNKFAECVFRTGELNETFRRQFADCSKEHGAATIIVGDSHAGNLFDAIAPLSGRPFFIGINKGFCRAVESNPQCFYDELLDFVATNAASIDKIIYMQAGFYLLDAPDGAIGSRDMFQRYTDRQFPVSQSRIDQTLAYLGKLANHANVVWLGPWIDPHVTHNQLVANGCNGATDLPNSFVIPSYMHLDQTVNALARKRQLSYLSTINALNFNARHDLVDCQNVYFIDADHWSVAGEQRFGPKVLEALNRTM